MIIRTKSELEEVFHRAESMDFPLDIDIKKHKEKRNLSQNAKWQAMSRDMAEFTGYSHAEMKVVLQRELLGEKEVTFKWKGNETHRMVVIGTEDLSKEAFSNFLMKAEAIAAEMGLYD